MSGIYRQPFNSGAGEVNAERASTGQHILNSTDEEGAPVLAGNGTAGVKRSRAAALCNGAHTDCAEAGPPHPLLRRDTTTAARPTCTSASHAASSVSRGGNALSANPQPGAPDLQGASHALAGKPAMKPAGNACSAAAGASACNGVPPNVHRGSQAARPRCSAAPDRKPARAGSALPCPATSASGTPDLGRGSGPQPAPPRSLQTVQLQARSQARHQRQGSSSDIAMRPAAAVSDSCPHPAGAIRAQTHAFGTAHPASRSGAGDSAIANYAGPSGLPNGPDGADNSSEGAGGLALRGDGVGNGGTGGAGGEGPAAAEQGAGPALCGGGRNVTAQGQAAAAEYGACRPDAAQPPGASGRQQEAAFGAQVPAAPAAAAVKQESLADVAPRDAAPSRSAEGQPQPHAALVRGQGQDPVSQQLGAALPPEVTARLRKRIRIIQPISRTWVEETLQSGAGGCGGDADPGSADGTGGTTGGTNGRGLGSDVAAGGVAGPATAAMGGAAGSAAGAPAPLRVAALPQALPQGVPTLATPGAIASAVAQGQQAQLHRLQQSGRGALPGSGGLWAAGPGRVVQRAAAAASERRAVDANATRVDGLGAATEPLSVPPSSAPLLPTAGGHAAGMPPPRGTGVGEQHRQAAPSATKVEASCASVGPAAGAASAAGVTAPAAAGALPFAAALKPPRADAGVGRAASFGPTIAAAACAPSSGGRLPGGAAATAPVAPASGKAAPTTAGAAGLGRPHQPGVLQPWPQAPQRPAPTGRNLGKVQGELTLLYQWYVANKTAYLDQAQRQLRRVEALAAAAAAQEAGSAGDGIGAAAAAAAKAESGDAVRAFETALHIMRVCGSVERQCLALAPAAAAASAGAAAAGAPFPLTAARPQQTDVAGRMPEPARQQQPPVGTAVAPPAAVTAPGQPGDTNGAAQRPRPQAAPQAAPPPLPLPVQRGGPKPPRGLAPSASAALAVAAALVGSVVQRPGGGPAPGAGPVCLAAPGPAHAGPAVSLGGVGAAGTWVQPVAVPALQAVWGAPQPAAPLLPCRVVWAPAALGSTALPLPHAAPQLVRGAPPSAPQPLTSAKQSAVA